MIIGLTGKSCSGKNYVGILLKRKGFEVLDLDREASAIRKEKSEEVGRALGTTDARIIRDLVFEDPAKLKALEDIIYPVLVDRIKALKKDVIINGATIYRAGLDKICSFVIYVDAPYNERLERAKNRDRITEEQFLKREQSQKDVDYRSVEYRCPVHVLLNSKNDVTRDLDKILSAL